MVPPPPPMVQGLDGSAAPLEVPLQAGALLGIACPLLVHRHRSPSPRVLEIAVQCDNSSIRIAGVIRYKQSVISKRYLV